jgi:hypothetical protein
MYQTHDLVALARRFSRCPTTFWQRPWCARARPAAIARERGDPAIYGWRNWMR